MVILGIETSCDETAASVVEDGRKVLSHVLATSADMHAKTGGIIPEVAAREQVKAILPVIQQALADSLQSTDYSKTKNAVDRSRLAINHIDAIAVTVGPGLIGSLLVGVETARTLAWVWNKPIVPVNHLVGHIYANWLRDDPPSFPALGLVVSGGHTDLVLMKRYGKMQWIGGTRDDAAGEAFDKTARLLGLPYPGGPEISRLADAYRKGNPNTKLDLFPRPMLDNFSAKTAVGGIRRTSQYAQASGWDWSFSGLKTAVAREVKSNPTSLKLRRAELAAQVQEAIIDSIVTKTLRALKMFKPKSLLLGGGVAANQRLKEKFKLEIRNSKLKIDFYVPPPILCTDNASMIAAGAYYHYLPLPWQEIKTIPELTIVGEF